jgi:catalase
MSAAQKQTLFDNTGRAMGDAPKDVKLRHIGHCLKADPAYGEGVAKALGIPVSEARR